MRVHTFLVQLHHLTIIGLNGDELESEWYVVIREGHELTRPVLTLAQTHAGEIRYAPHNIEHHRAAVLVEGHGYKVSAKILHI